MNQFARSLAQEIYRAVSIAAREGQTFPISALRPALITFLADPTPGTYLMVTLAIRERVRALLEGSLGEVRAQAMDRALDLVEHHAKSGVALSQVLRHAPRDAKAAMRVQCLALLVGAYEELESRAQVEREEQRQKIGLPRQAR